MKGENESSVLVGHHYSLGQADEVLGLLTDPFYTKKKKKGKKYGLAHTIC